MKPRLLIPTILMTALLAACGGGGAGNSSPNTTLPQSTGSAYGTLSFTVAAPSSAKRKPEFVSSGTRHAAFFVGGVLAGQVSSCTTTCTIAWTAASGTNLTLEAEVDNGTYFLAAVSATQTLLPGANDFALTPNGAAGQFTETADTCSTTVSCTATYGIGDSTSVSITGTAFDTGTITLAVDTADAAIGTITGGGTLAAPSGLGTTYQNTVACQAAATGTFHLTATSGTPAGTVTSPELTILSPVAYHAALLTSTFYTYTCTNGAITDSTGTLTLN
jgi:hypothetical protein